MSKCNCFQEKLDLLSEQLKMQIPADATEFSIEWENYIFVFSDRDHIPVNPRVKYQYRNTKRDGSPAKNLSKDSASIMAQYCPFCGRKVENQDVSEEEAMKDALHQLRDAIQNAEQFGLVRTEDGTAITGAIESEHGVVLVRE